MPPPLEKQPILLSSDDGTSKRKLGQGLNFEALASNYLKFIIILIFSVFLPIKFIDVIHYICGNFFFLTYKLQ